MEKIIGKNDFASIYSQFFVIYFLIASFAPQTEHLPSAVIFGCSPTSAPQSPHFTKISHLQRVKCVLPRDISNKTFAVA